MITSNKIIQRIIIVKNLVPNVFETAIWTLGQVVGEGEYFEKDIVTSFIYVKQIYLHEFQEIVNPISINQHSKVKVNYAFCLNRKLNSYFTLTTHSNDQSA